MEIRSFLTTNQDTNKAFQEIKSKLSPQAKAVIFFASTVYDFQGLSTLFREAFPNAEVLGLTTVGEIGPLGFSENGLSAMSFSGSLQAKGVLIEDIVKYPIFYRDNLVDAARQIGIDAGSAFPEREGLGLVFPNGLIGAEEKMLSVVNSVFAREGFSLFGGTAGDDAKFEKTQVSYQGSVSHTGGLVLFIKPDTAFHIAKENIFSTTGQKMKITKADAGARIVYEFNGRSAASEYARLLGVSAGELSRFFMTNPLGRVVNEEVFIASPFEVLPGGGVKFYCQLFEGMTVDVLAPKDPVATMRQTVEAFQGRFSRLDGVLAVNCILRKFQFHNDRLFPALNSHLEKLPNLGGFCSYGEQLNRTQLNQTLVLLGFGTLRQGESA
ncbi:FIST signal transduction protein [Saccharibacillus kuerlensis]|uniref:FIST domain-containing protein n=1 Tax=Saccharibacillus kuerlensis TaxID=459527 RepID=A0ABQ2L4X3_9BACL|nr:FIST N-terminal domain-containing protein [Saccharibacillus kuerlensis]GGO03477.1 hypothetical protein GCM10010969_27790 [Saccharibacillus kuerlensis]